MGWALALTLLSIRPGSACWELDNALELYDEYFDLFDEYLALEDIWNDPSVSQAEACDAAEAALRMIDDDLRDAIFEARLAAEEATDYCSDEYVYEDLVDYEEEVYEEQDWFRDWAPDKYLEWESQWIKHCNG